MHRRSIRVITQAVVVAIPLVLSMPLLGMSGIASAAQKGSAKWCATHPKKAKAIASCSAAGAGTGGAAPLITIQIDPNPLVETGTSNVVATVQVETAPSFAGDLVHIDSSQLEASCETVTFTSIQPAAFDDIQVVLDDDGNATVLVYGSNCAPGQSVFEADLERAPYYTALGTLTVLPPVVTASGVFGYPATSGTAINGEVETGDTAASGDSDVYGVFYVETDPVYAEQTVEITSSQLAGRCAKAEFDAPPPAVVEKFPLVDDGAATALDDDGNAVFFFLGESCAAGSSEIIADVLAGNHPTYLTTFTVLPPQPTI